MRRIRVTVLAALFLASVSRAQPPVQELGARPAPAGPQQVEQPRIQQPALNSNVVETDPNVPLLNIVPSQGDSWRFWVSADYALAWLRGKNLPPLVTSSPVGTVQTAAGVLGNPATTVLIGNSAISDAPRSMGRLDFGLWVDPEHTFGMSAGFFVIQGKGINESASSNTTAIIARPFNDVTSATNAPSSVLVAFPGVSTGSVDVFAAMRTFWSAYFDLQEAIISRPGFRLESLIGYRYLHYGETLDMQQTVNPLGAAFIPGTSITSQDSFQTINNFHACEFGFHTQISGERWSLDLLTKLAAGNIRREIIIRGSTQTTVPGTPVVNDVGGVYALSSNIGNTFTSTWVAAPELGLGFSYEVMTNLRLRLGYSFLYLPAIARAADQVDFNLNPNLFPPAIGGGSNRPLFNFVKSDMWIQSINLGMEFRF